MESYLTIQGNLVADPAQRVVASGARVTKFRLVSSGRRFDRAVGDWVSTDPVFLNVSCWRQLGDNVFQSLRKGDTVIVHGRLTFREWDDPERGRRSLYEIEAMSVGPDLGRYVVHVSHPTREIPAQGEPGGATAGGAPASDPSVPGVPLPAADAEEWVPAVAAEPAA
jgi:single-strand DNA-binding protein